MNLNCFRITEDQSEKENIARQIIADNPNVYSDDKVNYIKKIITLYFPESDGEKKDSIFYDSVYSY